MYKTEPDDIYFICNFRIVSCLENSDKGLTIIKSAEFYRFLPYIVMRILFASNHLSEIKDIPEKRFFHFLAKRKV